MFFRKIIALLLLSGPMTGQQLQFENLGARIPLPSQETYNIMQDSKGYIWFSTEQGFCRYDGHDLTVYDKTNGLPEGAVYSVAEDNRARLWLATSKSRILICENGKLREVPFSKALSKKIDEFAVACSLHFKDDQLYINFIHQTFIANIQTNQLAELPQKKSSDFSFLKSGNQLIPIAASRSLTLEMIKANPKAPVIALIDDGKNTQTVSVARHVLVPHPKAICSNPGNYSAFALTNSLVKIQAGRYQNYELPQRILSVHVDRDGGLWAGVLNQGLYYFPDGDLSQPPIVSLKGYSVTGILEDAEQNVWCTTLEKGLFLCRNKNVVHYSNIPELARPVEMLKSIGSKVYLSYGTKILVEENRQVQQFPIRYYGKEGFYDIIDYQNRLVLCGPELLAWTNPGFGPISIITRTDTVYIGAKQLLEQDGTVYLIFPGAFSWIENGYVVPHIRVPSRGRCFAALGDDQFLIGCDNGLYRVDAGTRVIEKVRGIDHQVTQILPHGKMCWITTKGGGLYQYANGKTIAVNERFKIPSLILFDIERYKNDLWIGSNKGLVQLSPDKNTYSTSVFGIRQGLPANEFYKLETHGHRMFLSTLEGVCSFLPDVPLQNTTAPAIHLRHIFVNGLPKRSGRKLTLPYNANTLRLLFDLSAYKSVPELKFELIGRDRHFRKQSGSQILLEDLPPGAYQLTVYAVNSDGVTSVNPVRVKFDIEKPFWQNAWFLAVCGLVLVLGLVFLVRKIIRSVRSSEAEKTRINKLIADSQLSALQAQMNPHFIFNAINSIQNYILKRQETEAYSYLAKFSKLIRLVLHHSQQQILPLQEELETIRLYIELEQLRFDNFDFELALSESVNAYETMVPAMIIQPYLENAIWHGLMQLEGQRRGKISLAFEAENGLLRICITDNGIGRKRSAEFRKDHTHKPVAMKITAQRIEILNQQYANEKISVAVEDLYENDSPSGTRVVIRLPISQPEEDEREN